MHYLIAAGLLAATFDLPTTGQPDPKNLRLDQVDTTDALAVPFDTSEVEDEIEIDDMHQDQNEYFKTHPEAYQEWLRTHKK